MIGEITDVAPTPSPSPSMGVGDIVREVGKVSSEPVHIDDELSRLWAWLGLAKWDWDNIVAVVVILVVTLFVVAFSTGGRRD